MISLASVLYCTHLRCTCNKVLPGWQWLSVAFIPSETDIRVFVTYDDLHVAH